MYSGSVLYITGRVITTGEAVKVLENLNCKITVVKSLEQAAEILGKKSMDLILFNLGQIQQTTILDFAQKIGKDTPFIFLDIEQNNAFYEQVKQITLAYLVDPIDLLSLRSIITHFLMNKKGASAELQLNILNDSLFIKVNQILQKVKISDITHVRSEGNYCEIFTPEKKFAIKLSMVKLRHKLDAQGFVQVQKSYLAQLNKIDNIDISGNEIMIGDLRIPLGRKYKPKLLSHLNLL